jgi:hypothetical protein
MKNIENYATHLIIDDLIKSLNFRFSVIPAEAGIQSRSERDLKTYKYPGLRFPPE